MIYRTDLTNEVITIGTCRKSYNLSERIGPDGMLWSFFLMIALIMLGVYRPSISIIFSVIGFILMSLFGLVDIGIASLFAILAIAAVLMYYIMRE